MAVIDFKSKAFWKQLEKRFDLLRAEIKYAGITRQESAANQTASDPITFDAETASAVKALFSKYGFPTEPRTWAEFRAPHAYIERIEEAVDTFRIGFPHIPQLGIEFLRSKYSDVVDVAMLIIEDRYEEVASFHKKRKTYEKLVRNYDELAELPDPDPDRFR
jgi:hypothetical protein